MTEHETQLRDLTAAYTRLAREILVGACDAQIAMLYTLRAGYAGPESPTTYVDELRAENARLRAELDNHATLAAQIATLEGLRDECGAAQLALTAFKAEQLATPPEHCPVCGRGRVYECARL